MKRLLSLVVMAFLVPLFGVAPLPVCAQQLVFTTQEPDTLDTTDGVPLELGMKFQSAQPGEISALRYWKAPSDTGANIVGKLWAVDGTLLASVTFSGQTASGWQEQALAVPVAILADTTYLVSVNINSHYVFTSQGLMNSIVNGDLRTVADGANGVFSLTPGTFPTDSFQETNYFRDIVFVEMGPDPLCGNGAIEGGEECDDGNNFDGDGCSAFCTIEPVCGDGIVDVGEECDDSNLVSGDGCSALCEIEGLGRMVFTTQEPDTLDTTDGVPLELGMKFQSAQPGEISALRYWKAPSDTGANIVGKLWAADGTLLASVTFSGQTAAGWQEQALAAPVAIAADTTYLVSVNINSHYVFTSQGLMNSIVSGDLRTVADGANGVFNLMPGEFPTASFNNTNYFRDIVLVEMSPDPLCGDGALDAGEECDDGNTLDGDGCSALCTTEVCGNGAIDAGEECDDGNLMNGDGCSALCTIEPFCGDGNTDVGEECDDGNSVDGDGCSASCTLEPVCGDGIVDVGEECDDSNLVSGDGCSALCELELTGCLTRSSGFWKTHPNTTIEFLPVESAGLTVDNVNIATPGSAIEDMCVNGQDAKAAGTSSQQLQLIRQCTAAALNTTASTAGNGNCEFETPGISDRIAECCADLANSGASGPVIGGSGCIEDLDAFNNREDTLALFGAFVNPGPADPSNCQTANGNGFVNPGRNLGPKK